MPGRVREAADCDEVGAGGSVREKTCKAAATWLVLAKRIIGSLAFEKCRRQPEEELRCMPVDQAKGGLA